MPRPSGSTIVALVLALTTLASGPALSRDGGTGQTVPEVEIAAGRTTTVIVQPFLGQPFERQAEFLTHVPSYGRAIALDREQRWSEAAALYQQALTEVASTIKVEPSPLWERATFKIDTERRRSQVLAHDSAASNARGADRRPMAAPWPTRGAGGGARLSLVERGRLLRLKMMSVRAATGAVPTELFRAAIHAFNGAIGAARVGSVTATTQGASPPRLASVRHGSETVSPPRESRGGDPEVRLLLCAARAAGGDRAGARLELAHVAERDRSDPARALALAACQGALRQDDQALASLAVAVYRLGPSSRFLPGQTRELQSSNDWDVLRADARFDLLFR